MIVKNLIIVDDINVCEDLTEDDFRLLEENPETSRCIDGSSMKVFIYQQSDDILN